MGQVVLTNDGLLGSVTDYGNFSYAWRSTGVPFKEFILSMDTNYFAKKIEQGLYNVPRSKSLTDGIEFYARMILPALKEVLLQELEIEKQRNK